MSSDIKYDLSDSEKIHHETHHVETVPMHLDRDIQAGKGTGADLAQAIVDSQVEFIPNPELERRLLRKVDFRLVPMVAVIYLLNYLDRNNVGNAKTAGMAKDLHMTSSDYSLAVSVFFIGYLLLEAPSNMILARVRPSWYLPGLMFVWGSISIAYIGVKKKGDLIAIRLCLGLVESGFFAGVLLYMSLWYKKHELARRFSLFYCASLLSGAFGGLIAGGVVKTMSHRGSLPAWKWLFLIEGAMTVGVSIIAFFVLPDYPANTKWLSPEERAYAVARLAAENNHDTDEDENIGHWQSFMMAIKDWRMYFFLFGQTCVTCAGTITYFIPTLMNDLGYHGDMAQFMTVPIYATSLVVLILTGFSSDYHQERPKHLMFASGLSTVSLAIVAGSTNHKVRYAFLCFGGAGIWTCCSINLTYMTNTITRPKLKKAAVIGLVNGSYIWPSNTAPRYIPGFVTTTCLQLGTFLFAVTAWYIIPRYPYPYEIRERERRAELARRGSGGDDESTSEIGQAHGRK